MDPQTSHDDTALVKDLGGMLGVGLVGATGASVASAALAAHLSTPAGAAALATAALATAAESLGIGQIGELTAAEVLAEISGRIASNIAQRLRDVLRRILETAPSRGNRLASGVARELVRGPLKGLLRNAEEYVPLNSFHLS